MRRLKVLRRIDDDDDKMLPVELLNKVDWDKLTETQAAALGSVLGTFNDAYDEYRNAATRAMTWLLATCAALIAGTIVTLWTRSGVTIVVSIAATMLAGTLLAFFSTLASSRALSTSETALEAEAERLSEATRA